MPKIVVLSDTHERPLDRWEIPDGDILVHCGDGTARGSIESIQWFGRQLLAQPHRYKIFVPGNHDQLFYYDKNRGIKEMPGIIVLYDECVELMGVRFYGTPWLPFRDVRPFNTNETKWLDSICNENIDVLITHGPPKDILDLTVDGRHLGNEKLNDCFKTMWLKDPEYILPPSIHCFGHIHESYGKTSAEDINFYNAAMCDEKNQPVEDRKPWVIEI